jgi:hypothetical protein
MPETLTLNLPPEVVAELREAAATNGTTVEAEAVARIVKVVRVDKLPPLGEPIPSLEMIAPYHFPDKGPGTPVKVVWRDGPPPSGYRYEEGEQGR